MFPLYVTKKSAMVLIFFFSSSFLQTKMANNVADLRDRLQSTLSEVDANHRSRRQHGMLVPVVVVSVVVAVAAIACRGGFQNTATEEDDPLFQPF